MTTRRIIAAKMALALALASFANPVMAREIIWPRVALERHGNCEVEVIGPGQFFKISVRGLQPREEIRFIAVNSNQNTSYNVKANEAGEWWTFYIPLLRDRTSGIVIANVQSANCYLSFSFPWSRTPFHAND